MKKIWTVLLCVGLIACGGGNDRTEQDITDGDEQNLSPNQTISEEEQQKKDSTSIDIVGEDTTQTNNQ